MKKNLLVLGALALGLNANAQILKTQNFDNLNVGNLSTDVTGNYYGQGNIVLTAQTTANGAVTASGNPNHYQIINDNTNGNKGKILSVSIPTAVPTSFIADFEFDWSTRTTGNNILKFTQWFYTGGPTAATGAVRYAMFGLTGPQSGQYIGGFQFEPSTKILTGYTFGARATQPSPGGSLVALAQGGLVLPSNTWIEAKYSYEPSTGNHYWFIENYMEDGYFTSSNTATPYQYVNITFNETNTTAYNYLSDNYTIEASNNSNLPVDEHNLLTGEIKLFPNPANDVVNIASTQGVIEHYAIVDLTGKTVKYGEVSNLENLSVNIQDLASGAYIMNIKTDKAIKNLKFVKK